MHRICFAALASFLLCATLFAEDAAKPELFWCDSTDTAKLNLIVTEENGQYFLSDSANYQPKDKTLYYFVNWDLLGTKQSGQRITRLKVEPNSLYLIHLYELSRGKNLGDFWSNDPGKKASVAFVWVGGKSLPSVPAYRAGNRYGVERNSRRRRMVSLRQRRPSADFFAALSGLQTPQRQAALRGRAARGRHHCGCASPGRDALSKWRRRGRQDHAGATPALLEHRLFQSRHRPEAQRQSAHFANRKYVHEIAAVALGFKSNYCRRIRLCFSRRRILAQRLSARNDRAPVRVFTRSAAH